MQDKSDILKEIFWGFALSFVILLVFMTPMAYAIIITPPSTTTRIRITDGSETRTVVHDAALFVERNVTLSNGVLRVNVNAPTNRTINRILLFLCGSKNPVSCVRSVKPIDYGRSVDSEFNLNDISEGGIANLLTLARTDSSWIGFWDAVEGGDVKSSSLEELSLSTTANIRDVEDFIKSYGMIPLNWIESPSLDAYQLGANRSESDSTNLNFTYFREGGSIEDVAEYLFALAKGLLVRNPLTFYSNVPGACGNNLCELGENSANCWQDCGCPNGTAPTPSGCVNASEVRIVIDSASPNPIECIVYENKCTFTDILTLKLHIINPPTGYLLNDYYYSLSGESRKDIFCIQESGSYECMIVMPDRSAGASFSEQKELKVYFTVSYRTGDLRTLEISGGTTIGIVGTKLLDAMDLKSLQDKMAELQKMIKALQMIKQGIEYLLMIFRLKLAYHIAMAAYYCSQCGPFCLTCCVHCEIHKEQVAIWSKHVSIVQMILNQVFKQLQNWINNKIKEAEDKLRQRQEAIGQEAARTEAEARKKLEEAEQRLRELENRTGRIRPNLVWVSGDVSGDYTDKLCGSEQATVWYDISPLSCIARSTMELTGREKVEVNPNGTHTLYTGVASALFAANNTLSVKIDCINDRFGNVTDELALATYQSECGGG